MSCLYLSRWHYFTLYEGILQDIAARWGRFFCCSECGLLCGLGNGWPATVGARVLAGSGCRAGSEVGPAPCNSPPGAGGGPETGPRGNCVAVMPCGAWDYEIRKSKGPGVAPCFLVCVIGSDCSLFRDLPYNYRAIGPGDFPVFFRINPIKNTQEFNYREQTLQSSCR